MTTEEAFEGVRLGAQLEAVLFKEESVANLLARLVRAVEGSVPAASSVRGMIKSGSAFGAGTATDDGAAGLDGAQLAMSVPLVVLDEVVGSIDLYAPAAVSFSAADREIVASHARQAGVLATNLATLSTAEDRNAQLVRALETREMVGQAMGVLMERESCSREQAFDILRRASQRENKKLRDVAHRIISIVEDRGET